MRIKENVRETHDNSPISHSLAHRHTANPIFMGCKSFCGLVRLLIAFKSYSLWSAQIWKRLPKMKSEAVIIKISNSIGNWRWYANAKCEMKMYAIPLDFASYFSAFKRIQGGIALHQRIYISHSQWFKTSKNTALPSSGGQVLCKQFRQKYQTFNLIKLSSLKRNYMMKKSMKINQSNDLELRIFHPISVRLEFMVYGSLPLTIGTFCSMTWAPTVSTAFVKQLGHPQSTQLCWLNCVFKSIKEHCLCPINNATDVE